MPNIPQECCSFEIAKQLIRSAGSVGANYRAACRGKSKADFIYKLEIVLEEADESLYWLEVIKAASIVQSASLELLLREANELVRIFSAADITAKKKRLLEVQEMPPSQNPKITK